MSELPSFATSSSQKPYKVDVDPIPLDTLAVCGGVECWYRVPSWRVHFDHDALRDADIRLHRAIGSHAVWTLTEATTGLKMHSDLYHENYMGDENAMLSEFAAGRMLQLTKEKLDEAIAKGKERLGKHSPNPFAVSERKPTWIPVSERMPEDFHLVLLTKNGVVAQGSTLLREDGRIWSFGGVTMHETQGPSPTHWMPLPEAPK